MHLPATNSTVFYVCPAPDGGWSVFGSDIAPALSTFQARDAAVQYACGIAEQAACGEVQILGWNGSVEEYHACASMTGSRPAYSRAIGHRA
jgi:Uncharacterized protein conserved in bacteria (DUF2188)